MQSVDAPEYNQDYRLERLSQILNYELSTVILLLLQIFMPFLLVLIIIAAVVLTPYMLFVLIKENKKTWIILFLIVVVVPAAVTPIVFYDSNYLGIFMFIPLFFFYVYCFLLKFYVKEWIVENNWRRQRMLDKKKKEI